MCNKIIRSIKKLKLKTLICLSCTTAAAWFLSGCQSNTIYFGTNTQFGIRAGVDTKQIPEVMIGYNRQEGVMLPLTIDSTNSLNGGGAVSENISDTKFIGANTNSSGIHQDAYSVIATFQGNAGGGGSVSNSANASMAVAQYFATGVAAQLLAEHGAAVVGGSSSSDLTVAQANAIAVQDAIKPLRNAYLYFNAHDTTPSQLPNFDAAAKTVLVSGTSQYSTFQNFLAGIPQDPTTDQVATVRTSLEANSTIKPQIK